MTWQEQSLTSIRAQHKRSNMHVEAKKLIKTRKVQATQQRPPSTPGIDQVHGFVPNAACFASIVQASCACYHLKRHIAELCASHTMFIY